MIGTPLDSLQLRIAAALALTAIALGATACGDSDDEAASGDTTEIAQPSDTAQGGTGAKPRDTAPAGQAAGPDLLGDRPQARAGADTVDDVYGDMREAIQGGVAASDVGVRDTLKAAEGTAALAQVCDLMSKDAQRRTVEYVERSAGLADVDWTCEKATGLLLRRAGRGGRLERAMRVTVVGVNAKGDRATATVRFGDKKRGLSTLPLVKEDGKWKLGTAPGGGD